MENPSPTNIPSRPEFIRCPRQGERCPVTGLSRPFLYDLIKRNQIKTISLRQRNASRGVRLICTDSLIDWINQHGEEVAT
jgi:hypothetical protein